jgi:excisionase family DNA binding protein
MQREGLPFPHIPFGHREHLKWHLPTSDNILTMLRNPFYAGAYAYGKTTATKTIVDGIARKGGRRPRPREEWTVLVPDHHEAYIRWEQYEQNRDRLARNAHGKRSGGTKSGRGGRALLSGLLRCRRCGKAVQVGYCRGQAARYACRTWRPGQSRSNCLAFGTAKPDQAVAKEVLLVVEPAAVEAALMAHADIEERDDERRRALELERQQADYEVRLCARRYESVDPDNRLVAAELEARWDKALERLRACEARLAVHEPSPSSTIDRRSLLQLSANLEAAWNAPTTTMRTKQQLVRALVEEIVVDVDEERREVILLLHWRGGQHSELRVRKPSSGEHGKHTSEEALQVIQQMATRWSDSDIAATLNRMDIRTGVGNTWTAKRVGSARNKGGIRAYDSAVKDGQCITMNEAAKKLGVHNQFIRKLIDRGILPARQVVRDAPWQIQAADLERPEVQDAVRNRPRRPGRPCRNSSDARTLQIPGT